MTTATRSFPGGDSLRDRLEYRLYLAAAYAIFLPVALAGRLLPRAMRPLGRSGPRVCVLEEAMTAARNAAPTIFMG